MTAPSPVRDASRFLARVSAFTPAEWQAVLAAVPMAAEARATTGGGVPPLERALRCLALPGRREAHYVLTEWLDAVATSLLVAVSDAPGRSGRDVAAALELAERATLALLVGDALDRRSFDQLYGPFEPLVPLAALRVGVALHDPGRQAP